MKKILISSVAMFALAFAVSASAATVEDMGSMTLKKGSTGAYVMALQKNLNACAGASLTVDGKFGKGSAAAAMTFQSAKGLATDGIVGSKTKAALAAACTGSTVSTGSTSTVPGCVAGAMFSSTTGAACGTGTSSTVISGGAGNIQSIITLGSPSSVTVSEGDSNKSVLGIEVKADSGSDLKVSNIGIKIAKGTGTGSTWVSRYINKVSIMQGSTVIGSVDASALSQNGNDYTANIAVDNSVIKANDRAQFYVAVNGNSTIDTSDSGTTLVATVTSIRYMDATGAVLTNSATNNQSFTLQKLSSNANVKVQVSEDNNNPRSRTVTSNYTSTTNDVSLLKFNVIASGTNMNFNKITAIATASGVNDVTQVSQLFKLKYNGNIISTVSFGNANTGSTTRSIVFGDTSAVVTAGVGYTSTSLNGGSSLMISAGQTGAFEILADVKPINTEASAGVLNGSCGTATAGTGVLCTAAFNAGDTLKVNLPSTEVLNNWSVLDQSGNNIAISTINRQGSATGYDATFRVQGISAALNSFGLVANKNTTTGAVTSVDFNATIAVTAAGSDFFMPRAVGFATSATDAVVGTNGVVLALLDGAYNYDAATTDSTKLSASLTAPATNIDGSGKIKIPAGQTVNLTLTGSLKGVTGQKVFQINAVGGAIDTISALTSFATLPAATFQSAQTASF